MRGIVSIAGYVPYRRLQRAEVAKFFGTGGGKGTRSVASHDEDTTTMGVEAARLALRGARGAAPGSIWFATASPAYLDKTNATTIHAALRQPSHVAAYDFGGALRSGVGAVRSSLAAAGTGATLVVLSASSPESAWLAGRAADDITRADPRLHVLTGRPGDTLTRLRQLARAVAADGA